MFPLLNIAARGNTMLIISAILSVLPEIFRVRRTIYHRYFKLNLVDKKSFTVNPFAGFRKKGK